MISDHTRMFIPDRAVFVGLGGIGSWLVEPAAFYLETVWPGFIIELVDGDTVENRNRQRQLYGDEDVMLPKVEAMKKRLINYFPASRVAWRPVYVEEHNVSEFVNDNAIVFLMPDNHRVRRIVSEAALKLTNVLVFTAGNELHDGSCHVFFKNRGVMMSRTFISRHPEAVDGQVQTYSCEDLIDRGNAQLITTNYMISASVMMALHQVVTYATVNSPDGDVQGLMPQEVYGDVNKGKLSTVGVRGMPK